MGVVARLGSKFRVVGVLEGEVLLEEVGENLVGGGRGRGSSHCVWVQYRGRITGVVLQEWYYRSGITGVVCGAGLGCGDLGCGVRLRVCGERGAFLSEVSFSI